MHKMAVKLAKVCCDNLLLAHSANFTILTSAPLKLRPYGATHTHTHTHARTHTHTHIHLTAPFPGLPGSAGTRKAKPIWILLKQETVSGSGISWVICKSAPNSRKITMPEPYHSIFYRPDALSAAQSKVSKH